MTGVTTQLRPLALVLDDHSDLVSDMPDDSDEARWASLVAFGSVCR